MTVPLFVVVIVVVVLSLLPGDISAFRVVCPGRTTTVASSLYSSRRSFVENLTIVSIAAIASTAVGGSSSSPSSLLPVQPAWASGGATAGGAYLNSAKQRYNDRVQKGVVGFMSLQASLEKGDVDAVRDFFKSEDVGKSWKDLSTAGYLLANAFRTNSTAAPDTLPAVKVRMA